MRLSGGVGYTRTHVTDCFNTECSLSLEKEMEEREREREREREGIDCSKYLPTRISLSAIN